MSSTHKPIAEDICRVMRRVYDQELTTLTGGNISVMDEDGVMWTTPTAIDKAALRPEDIVRVFQDGHTEGRHRPTSEYRIHWAILKEHPELRAVIHAHSPQLVTMSILYQAPDTRIFPSAYEMFGQSAMSAYAPPGSMELVERVTETFRTGCRAAILENHAAFLASAKGLDDAYACFEQLDKTAFLQVQTPVIGTPVVLSREELSLFRAYLDRHAPTASEKPFTQEQQALADELAALSRRACGKRLFSSSQGVFSARTGADAFLISASGTNNAYIQNTDFVSVENGAVSGSRMPDPSYVLHRALYRAYPEVQSIILAAPAYAATFAVCRQPMDCTIIPESFGVLRQTRNIPLSVLAHQPETITEYLAPEHPVGLIDNFGILAIGSSPVLALDKLEVAEFTARSLHQISACHGEIHHLRMEQLLHTLG